MAESVLVQTKVRPDQKEQAERIFHQAGLSMGDAIRIFLQQTINAGDIPFSITARKPSAKLLRAIAQDQSGEGKEYDTIAQMMADHAKA